MIRGRIFDVAVDLRPGSPTFGRWYGAELSDERPRQLYMAPGFGHGFCVLSDFADLHYKVSRLYDHYDEGGIMWNDPQIDIHWPIANPIVSAREFGLSDLATARSRGIAAYWRTIMSTIVITGARGYIGSALVGKLAGEGHALRLVSRSFEAASLPPMRARNVEYCTADLRKSQEWSRLLGGVDAVVHLSSRTDLLAAESDPGGDRAINIEPVYSLVRAAEHLNNPVSLIFASSTSIVGDPHLNPVNEDTRIAHRQYTIVTSWNAKSSFETLLVAA